MLKIERVREADGREALRLAGEIRGAWVEELRRVAEGALDRGAALSVDLADVSFVDRHGAALLSRLAEREVALVNRSSFVSELLRAQA